MKRVIKQFPNSVPAFDAAYDLIDNKLCGDWQGLPKCPEMEANLYLKYANNYPESPKSPEALYNAVYREGVLVTMYQVQDDKKASRLRRQKSRRHRRRHAAAFRRQRLHPPRPIHRLPHQPEPEHLRQRPRIELPEFTVSADSRRQAASYSSFNRSTNSATLGTSVDGPHPLPGPPDILPRFPFRTVRQLHIRPTLCLPQYCPGPARSARSTHADSSRECP